MYVCADQFHSNHGELIDIFDFKQNKSSIKNTRPMLFTGVEKTNIFENQTTSVSHS